MPLRAVSGPGAPDQADQAVGSCRRQAGSHDGPQAATGQGLCRDRHPLQGVLHGRRTRDSELTVRRATEKASASTP